MDLFLKDIDLALQLGAHHPGVRQCGPGRLDGLIQFFDPAHDLLVFFFDIFILLRGLFQIPAGDRELAVRLRQLLPHPHIFQQEHIHVQRL